MPKIQSPLIYSLTALGLVLSLARCSPVAPSISKNGGVSVGTSTEGLSKEVSNASVRPVHIMTHQTRVVDHELFQQLVSEAKYNGEAVAFQADENSESLIRFIKEGKTSFAISDRLIPDWGITLLQVRASSSEITDLGWNDFHAEVKPSSESNRWELYLGSHVSGEQWKEIRQHIEKVAVILHQDQVRSIQK